MNNKNDGAGTLVERLREARGVPAVLKTKLASLRSQSPCVIVFLVEGVDDKIIYYHWLRQIDPCLRYEVLICNGKGRLLEFRNLLGRDVTGLGKNVYFLLDHDFDGLRGQAAGPDVFVTDTYSVENHLVTRDVVEAVLNSELHCHAEPTVRLAVLEIFERSYQSFLKVTRPHNQRIFTSRRVGIASRRPWPSKIHLVARVALREVTASEHRPKDVIELEREPTDYETGAHSDDFSVLNPATDYRGKFALLFFTRWLQLLAEDRSSQSPDVFKHAEKTSYSVNCRLPLDSLASRSTAPNKLRVFIDSVLAEVNAPQSSLGLDN